MKIGDLVTHKYNGGVGIITGSRFGHSNITMGTTEWFVIEWFQTPYIPLDWTQTQCSRDVYMPAFLELLETTDKKVNNLA